jgi:hypothetical protein
MHVHNTIIIGSGISGIFTLKHLIEEGNKNVLVLDKNPQPFGVWDVNNPHGVFENTHTVSSRLYMTISDYPMPENTPEFPHHSLILNYYKNYATHFNLYPYIKQNCSVISVKKTDGIWIITTKNTTYYTENVVIATGTVNDCPNIPDDEMYKNFTGEIYHSDSFDKIKNTTNKKILIVGGSDTAVDCATELIRKKNKITVSIKNGVWFQNRNLGAYEPADMVYNRALDFFIKNISSKKFIDNNTDPNANNNIQFYWGERGSGVDIWKSKCDYLNSYYVKSREIIDLISKGIVIPENGIVDIDKNKITFETKDSDEFDIILFCTGYKPLKCMKFLDDKIVNTQKYKHIFYENDHSIMFVGFIRPYLTSIPMLSELQSRWVAKVICKQCKLPSAQYMKTENSKDTLRQKKEFPCSYNRLQTLVDPYDYCNMIAKNIDAQINTTNLFFTNPRLLYMILFGSWNHYVYRLNDQDANKRKIAIEGIKQVYSEKSSIKLVHLIYSNIYYYLFYLLIALILVITFIYIIINSKIIKKINFSRVYKSKNK